MVSKYFHNPVLPGFYPDPSICRVDDDYYLVTSTFVYYPGIPIFHSKDLVHWEQIGHVLDRPSQLNLDGLGHSRGIFAPTIRHFQGTFYVIGTLVDKGENFIVTAAEPSGPWSDPYWLRDAPGIDPSLFFDHDGKTYYVGTRPVPEGPRYFGNWEIWLQQLDGIQMKLIGEVHSLWRGALRDAVWPEGPHIYTKDGWYYLLISEGGTDCHHAITIARSKQITGPYEGNPGNPILTHRHLGRAYPIQNAGHGDLVETQQGEWWIVLLGSRPYGGYYRNLGRETFLVPVQWENGWPVISPGAGRVESSYPIPNLPVYSVPLRNARDQFNDPKLDFIWNLLRTPREQFWSLTARPGFLRLKLKPEKIADQANPSFVGRRQQHINFTASTLLEFKPENEAETAGIAIVQSNEFHYRLEYGVSNREKVIRLVRCAQGIETLLSEKVFSADQIHLKVAATGQDYNFYYGVTAEEAQVLLEHVDGRILSTDVAGGFVGTYIGMFASSNGQFSGNTADFDWFEYNGII